MRKNYVLSTIIMLSTIMLMMTNLVVSEDQWDRPVYTVNFTPEFLNISNALNTLNSGLYNETQARIGNDTIIYNNLTYLYLNIDSLWNFTHTMNNSINDLYDSIVVLDSSINAINMTLTTFIAYTNTTMQSINESIKQPYGQYLPFNSSNFWVNETLLNNTINNISKNKLNLYTYSINVVNGTGNITSYNLNYLITRITINGNNNFRSECQETPTNLIIDKDRQVHHLTWDIEKNYAINSQVNCTITNANDGIYNLTITYISNGLQ
jgi:hypothetical protein